MSRVNVESLEQVEVFTLHVLIVKVEHFEQQPGKVPWGLTASACQDP